jgi:hypothetical protein
LQSTIREKRQPLRSVLIIIGQDNAVRPVSHPIHELKSLSFFNIDKHQPPTPPKLQLKEARDSQKKRELLSQD